ncbi:lipocalin family protein [Gramella sp. GC03-9]|uniref:Lipocalin family protein n=1 Tax=Christiangramia oceanisediminis TaxID=2920386 RepID=A0A9X2KYY7_9FLAO|nr:lipocalin family protein [Gramella oceanisediminis]MCP9200912.1 lipocalin family protein [Gramella oceanisediminis]
MKKYIFILSLVVLCSCTGNDPQEQLKNLNGYWMIEKVELENDSVVEFSLSQYVDYIEIEDSVGFRKKLQPQFGGKYLATDDAEKLKYRIEDDRLILSYSTAFDSWEEEVLTASEEELVVRNEDEKTYYYKKYEPIIIESDEETEKE